MISFSIVIVQFGPFYHSDTARVYCMSVYGSDAGETTDLTEDNAQAMGVQFA